MATGTLHRLVWVRETKVVRGVKAWFGFQLASQGVGEIHGEQLLAAQSKTYHRPYEI